MDCYNNGSFSETLMKGTCFILLVCFWLPLAQILEIKLIDAPYEGVERMKVGHICNTTLGWQGTRGDGTYILQA